MAVDATPGSPPDLTNSKSSKSSSFHSSSFSDIAGPNDISHFEDINLDDLHAALPSDLYHSYTTGPEHSRPLARTSISPCRKQPKQHPHITLFSRSDERHEAPISKFEGASQ
jgi:hypothetical protein